MHLLVKGKKPQPICRECRKLHSRAKCPKRKSAALRRSEEFVRFAREWSEFARSVAV